MKNEKLIKESKIYDKILNVVEKITFIIVALALAAIVIGPFLGKINLPLNSLYLGAMNVSLYEPIDIKLSSVLPSLEITLVYVMVYSFIIFYASRKIRKVMDPMKEGRPFDKSSSENIWQLGVFVVIAGIVKNILDFLALYAGYEFIDLFTIFDLTKIHAINYDYKFDVTFIIIALVVFILAYVFKYGESLQRDSDETL